MNLSLRRPYSGLGRVWDVLVCQNRPVSYMRARRREPFNLYPKVSSLPARLRGFPVGGQGGDIPLRPSVACSRSQRSDPEHGMMLLKLSWER